MPTVTTPALTLAEHAKLTGAVATKFAMSVYQGPTILKYLRLMTDPSISKTGIQVTNSGLPTVHWGRINKAADETRATWRDTASSLFLVTDIVPVDRRLLRAFRQNPNTRDPMKLTFDAYTAALNIEVTDAFVNGTGLVADSEADRMVGIKHMLDNPAAYYLASSSGTAVTKISGGGLNLSPSSGTAAAASNLCALIDEVLFAMTGSESGGPNRILLMDAALKRQWMAKGRTGGFFDQTRDAFNQRIDTYNGMPIVPLATKANGTTKIISTVEKTDGTAGVAGTDKSTSFYIIDLDQIDAWQPQVLKPERQTDDGVFIPFLIDWGVGIQPASDRWVGRGYNIQITD